MHDREQPGPEIRAGLPELFLDECAAQRVLHQIVCPVAVARQGPRVASQSRDLLFDESVKFGQIGFTSSVAEHRCFEPSTFSRLPAPVNQQGRDITEGEARDHRHERLFFDLTGCSLSGVTTGGQHVIRQITCLGPSLPCGLLNGFARFAKRFSRLARRRCGRRGFTGRFNTL
jgi:hypothetical protein